MATIATVPRMHLCVARRIAMTIPQRLDRTGVPSRFIAEMGLDDTTVKEDPRAKLRALRAEFAAKAASQATQDS